MKTHCAVCYNDRANNGGLSLEGFDAAVAPPSLAAMMLNKMTSGTALATVHAASHDQAAAAALDRGMKNGAIGAAGIGAPDKNTQDGRPPTKAEMYRLVPTCNIGTREGAMQLAWSRRRQRMLGTPTAGGAPGHKFRRRVIALL